MGFYSVYKRAIVLNLIFSCAISSAYAGGGTFDPDHSEKAELATAGFSQRVPQGTRDGGGDIQKPTRKKFTAQEVTVAIEEAAYLIPQFFSLLRIAPATATRFHCQNSAGVCAQSFAAVRSPGLKDTARLNAANLRFITQVPPCKNAVGKSVDASVANQNAQDVCISVSRLRSKLNQLDFRQDNAFVEIFALMTHEALHRFGISSEEIARETQVAVVNALDRSPVFNPVLPISTVPNEYRRFFLAQTLDSQKGAFEKLISRVDLIKRSSSPAKRCNDLQEIAQTLEGLIDDFTNVDRITVGLISESGFESLRSALTLALHWRESCEIQGVEKDLEEASIRFREFAGLPKGASGAVTDDLNKVNAATHAPLTDFTDSISSVGLHLHNALNTIGSPSKGDRRP
jgi:hypothetical protein